MKLRIVKMEADSTTLECDNNLDEIIAKERESDIFFIYNRERSFYNQTVKPLLLKESDSDLLEWMKDTGLLYTISKCPKNSALCKMKMTKAKVIDKYQWQCTNCKCGISIREKSVFKNTGISLAIALKTIQAWCYDMDYAYVSTKLGIKKQMVKNMFTKIEKIISMKSPEKLGGPESVVLVEIYPNGTVEHNPDSSRSDAGLTKHKILCLADTKNVPTRYLMHVMTGYIKQETENNNASLKKAKPSSEILDFITRNVRSGGFCMVGSSSDLNKLPELLSESEIFDSVASVETLSCKTDSQMKEFMTDTIWRQAVTVCEAAQELSKKQMQTYLDCAIWRREMSAVELFPHVLQIIAEQTLDRHGSKDA